MAATTETTICNLALGKIGARRVIDLLEESNEARACRLHYAETRDEILRHHRWNFASKRDSLVQVLPPPRFGWGYHYALPDDCLRVLEVNGWNLVTRAGLWEVEGRLLLSNDSVADVKYTSRVEDASRFDALFVEAFSLKLASKITMPINGSGPMAGELITQYERLVANRARRTDAFEANSPRRPAWQNSDLVMARWWNA